MTEKQQALLRTRKAPFLADGTCTSSETYLTGTVLADYDSASHHILVPLPIRHSVGGRSRIRCIASKVDTFPVRGRVFAAERSVETLLKDFIHHLYIRSVKQPTPLKTLQCLALDIIVFVALVVACFAVADCLPLHNVALPHGQVLNACNLDHLDLPRKSEHESINNCVIFGTLRDFMLLYDRRVDDGIPVGRRVQCSSVANIFLKSCEIFGRWYLSSLQLEPASIGKNIRFVFIIIFASFCCVADDCDQTPSKSFVGVVKLW